VGQLDVAGADTRGSAARNIKFQHFALSEYEFLCVHGISPGLLVSDQGSNQGLGLMVSSNVRLGS